MACNVLSFNPGHDGAIVSVRGGGLMFSHEAEKDTHHRHSTAGAGLLVDALAVIPEIPDVLAISGWEKRHFSQDSPIGAGYFGSGLEKNQVNRMHLCGKPVEVFSCSHERSHLLCAMGMSPFPEDQPCYALVWEGMLGAFYEIDQGGRIHKIGDVLAEPGSKYAAAYAIANPNHNSMFGLFDPSAAGKLMALAAFSSRGEPTLSEHKLIRQILDDTTLSTTRKEDFSGSALFDSGVESPAFKEFAGKFSDALFDRFFQFASRKLERGRPLLIVGGCGLNCEWNTRWLQSGLFSDVFVPPVANDTGVAIGAAVDAQRARTGHWKLEWDVYAGQPFRHDIELHDSELISVEDLRFDHVAGLLAQGKILACVQGRCEIGPRALGNRSLLAAPFSEQMRDRLNQVKQRESFRPIAPICLEEDAHLHFRGPLPSPYMLYFQQVLDARLKAVTHVDGTARAQTVNDRQNHFIAQLLREFRRLTGVAVLCNTSLNFKGFGFINSLSDLVRFIHEHDIDGAVVDGKLLLKRASATRNESAGTTPEMSLNQAV
jgi:hydroxymethyl cephem carbamoyltransferase